MMMFVEPLLMQADQTSLASTNGEPRAPKRRRKGAAVYVTYWHHLQQTVLA